MIGWIAVPSNLTKTGNVLALNTYQSKLPNCSQSQYKMPRRQYKPWYKSIFCFYSPWKIQIGTWNQFLSLRLQPPPRSTGLIYLTFGECLTDQYTTYLWILGCTAFIKASTSPLFMNLQTWFSKYQKSLLSYMGCLHPVQIPWGHAEAVSKWVTNTFCNSGY